MNRNKLKTYAPQARRDFIKAVTDRAAFFGLTEDNIEPVTEQGDVAIIGGKPFPRDVAAKRKKLEDRIKRDGFSQVMEAMAYTWFNRFVAIRYMEIHDYLDHGYRVLSNPDSDATPEIVEHAEHVDLAELDRDKVIELKRDGTKESELYRMLLIAQCNALHRAMPFLFEPIDDETELLVPENLLHSDSLVRKLVNEIPEEDWQEVEIIGWLYQFYISEKKHEVIGKVVKTEDIPAATQLFTPNWIVKYLVQNSLGRQWMATYSESSLKDQMEFYIKPAEQTPEVQAHLKEITPESLNPEELTLLDPACGSGHILVEAYDLLKAIYQERGYRAKDIPRLILEKNLYGLDIDARAAQLAAFALLMKARADDRRIFDCTVQPHVLAIHESEGLDAREITEALNQPIFKGEAPPPESLFEEIDDDKAPLFSRKNLSESGHVRLSDVAQLIELFKHGKTFGSLIEVPKALAEKLQEMNLRIEEVKEHGDLFGKTAAGLLKRLIGQAVLLARRYHSVAMNPPYMGWKSMSIEVKNLAADSYAASKSDFYSMFIEQGCHLARPDGFIAMVAMHSWMFLATFQSMREKLLRSETILTLAHLGARAFSTISGEVVKTAAFSMLNRDISGFVPTFFRLLDGDETQKRTDLAQERYSFHRIRQDDFEKIPGSPIAYWVSPQTHRVFSTEKPLAEVAHPTGGMTTGNNDLFLRFWFEVSEPKIGFNCANRPEAKTSGKKWFPYNKGGSFRKWYGNAELVVNWWNDGQDIIDHGRAYPRSKKYYFQQSITWTATSSSSFAARHSDQGFIFDAKGSSCFCCERDHEVILALLCSTPSNFFLEIMNPTLEFQVGDVGSIPVPTIALNDADFRSKVREIALACVTLVRDDWNLKETSWEFKSSPLASKCGNILISSAFDKLQSDRLEARSNLKTLEERNNSLFIDAFGLDGQVSPVVSDEYVSLYSSDREQDAKCLLSYAIGCIMGRYSLDEPGLIYAHNGNQGFAPDRYKIFPADEDGIIPITDTAWFDDDAANRFVEFVSVAWPEEHLEENLEFIAESIGKRKTESAREAIRRYLSTGFYKHHLSMYKKRPIYWLFSSGKQRAFQCLVYLHRYNEGTLSRMRTEYVIPLQGKIDARIEQLKDDIAAATSTAHGKKLQKERDKLVKQQTELQSFDEKLRHYADQRISLDLDDGVKVNYGKFGNLLVEVKAVTGKKAEG